MAYTEDQFSCKQNNPFRATTGRYSVHQLPKPYEYMFLLLPTFSNFIIQYRTFLDCIIMTTTNWPEFHIAILSNDSTLFPSFPSKELSGGDVDKILLSDIREHAAM
jgi:hypothetical protein